MSKIDDLFAWVREDRVAELCAWLVRTNTVNPPGNERGAAELVRNHLVGAGFEDTFLPFPREPERASVVCRLKGDRDTRAKTPALMFSCHLDVVPVGAQPWRHEPFAGDVADGQVWGRGAADMKSGVAAMLVAAHVLGTMRSSLRGDLLFAATAGEEIGMQGAMQVAGWPELGPLAAVIISEPTNNTLGLAERGVLWIELATQGQTAHSATPHFGRNAIDMMRRLLDGLDAMRIPFTPHPVLGDFTRSINTIEGGTANNVVPDRCVATIDMRTLPGQDHAAIVRQVEKLAGDLAAREPGFSASVRAPFDLPAVDTPEDHPAVQAFMSAVQAATGRPARQQAVRFATEAGIFNPRLDVPCIIFGPGDPALAHQPDEHAAIDKMVEAARVYVAAALAMLG